MGVATDIGIQASEAKGDIKETTGDISPYPGMALGRFSGAS
jgi:hypothetical protein